MEFQEAEMQNGASVPVPSNSRAVPDEGQPQHQVCACARRVACVSAGV
jgi:hypothetical protein